MIFYSLDQERKEGELFLVIHLKTSERRLLYRDRLNQLAKGEDGALIKYLMEWHFKAARINPLSSQAETLSFNKISLPAPHSLKALQLLATTNRVHFKNKMVKIQLSTKAEFFYELSEMRLTGKVRFGEREIFLKECDFLFQGPPSWFIHEGYLFLIHQEWKWIKGVYPEPKQFDLKTLSLWQEEIEGEQGLPQIRTLDASKKSPIFPYLVLQDRTGAFADLWFDYGDHQIALHDTATPSWRRFEEEKYWEKDLLETAFQKKVVGGSHYYCPIDKIAQNLIFLLEMGWKIVDHQKRKVVASSAPTYSLSMVEEQFKLEGALQFEGEGVDLKKIGAHLKKQSLFLELSSGTVGLLDKRVFPKEILDFLDEEQGSVDKRNFALLEPIFNLQEVKKDKHVSTFYHEIKNRPYCFVPKESFKGVLYPYQQEGVDWLKSLYDFGFHGLLADEMGLGKTVQLLAFISHLEIKKPILIVVPTSLLFNWKREIEKFLPSFAVYEHQGKERLISADELKEKTIILTSYALLRMDLPLLEAVEYETLILDEAQNIKNPQSQTAQAACRLRAQFRVAITGTPIENRVDELFSIFHFLMKGYIDPLDALDKIAKKVRPFILRRKKEIVGQQLPEKIEQTVWVEMGDEQKLFYEEFLQTNKQKLKKKMADGAMTLHRMEILEVLLRLRQICCHPHLVDGSYSQEERASAKLEQLMQDLESVVGEQRKVLVYSQFTQMLSSIRVAIEARNISYVYLDGETKNREEVVNSFQQDPDISVFLISLKAGGVGLNLTEADYVFIYDPWWNEAAERQAIDRAHRIGRKGVLIAKRYVMAGTIEEKMMLLKEHKSELLSTLFDLGESTTPVSLDDLYNFILS